MACEREKLRRQCTIPEPSNLRLNGYACGRTVDFRQMHPWEKAVLPRSSRALVVLCSLFVLQSRPYGQPRNGQ
jgi:hypothetical protein